MIWFKCCDNPKCLFNNVNMSDIMAMYNANSHCHQNIMEKMMNLAQQNMSYGQKMFQHNSCQEHSNPFLNMPYISQNYSKSEDFLRTIWENMTKFAHSYIEMSQNLMHKYMHCHENSSCHSEQDSSACSASSSHHNSNSSQQNECHSGSSHKNPSTSGNCSSYKK